MRSTAATRHRIPRQGTANVSLFPFLAVLICTMGALILLLVVIARQARLYAAETAQTAADDNAEELQALRTEREMVQWRIEQLQNSLKTTESQLSEARLELGHVEDHARRLGDQLARLKQASHDLKRLSAGGSLQREQIEAELQRLKEQIAQAQRALQQANSAARRRSYAVVPYRGPHQTLRRPIYIECGPSTIAVQPEGIVLTEDDFDGPMGAGNPLAAALRAAREYLLTHGGIQPDQTGEPYPLLLVRPDGIVAYYAARAAMKSWGSEFGYELIGEDWELAFQRPDPQLAEEIRRAVQLARVRQARLAAAAPSQFRKSTRPMYRVAPTRGGIVRDDGSFQRGGSGPGWGNPPGSVAGRAGAAGRGGGAGGNWPDRTPSSEGTAVGGSPQQGATAQRRLADGPPRERPPSTHDAGSVPPRPGQWEPKPDSPADASPAGRSHSHPESLAKTRGRNWALPEAGGGSVPLTRPIRIECHADRLLIAPERGLSGARAVALGPRTEDAMDEFRSAIWEHMDSWGIAGKGMYWRPTLRVYVAPDAERRFAELKTLLDNSGLTIERKTMGVTP